MVFPCQSCGDHIAPSREHLHGWQDAQTEAEAEAASRWACPSCGWLFDDVKRREMLQRAKLRHRGQFIDATGKITGDIPRDLERQWIQGTGPGAKPHTTLERSIRKFGDSDGKKTEALERLQGLQNRKGERQ